MLTTSAKVYSMITFLSCCQFFSLSVTHIIEGLLCQNKQLALIILCHHAFSLVQCYDGCTPKVLVQWNFLETNSLKEMLPLR